MNLRVNLIKESERRYQGPVSLRFLLRSVGMSVGALLLIYVVLAIHGQFMLQRNLKAAREEWTRLGPRYDEITKKQATMASYKALLDELNMWGPTNGATHELLLVLQTNVPPAVQLLKLDIGADWIFVKPEVKKPVKEAKPKEKGAAPPKGEEGKKAEKPVAAKDLPSTPGRQLRLTISGRVTGSLADEVVVQFTKNLHKSPGFSTTFDSMELQKLFREDTTGRSGGDWRQFEILGTAKPRMMAP